MTTAIRSARNAYTADSPLDINANRVLCVNDAELKAGDTCHVQAVTSANTGHTVLHADATPSKRLNADHAYRDASRPGTVVSVTPDGDVWADR